MKKIFFKLFIIHVLFVVPSCKNTSTNEAMSEAEPALFTLLTAEQTHIDFQNIINEGLNTNVLMYEYFYNGGGVAIGDLNNDGFDDIYFSANMSGNKLYLNKGNRNGQSMQFEDITQASGTEGRNGPWKTGVTMADVNADGLLDIYLCYSGSLPPEKKTNQLFINQGINQNGIPTFAEKAAEFGLDSPASSTNAYFFDYDQDNDLDMFLLNHNIKSLPVLNEANSAEWLKTKDVISGCRLFRNDRGAFTDITDQSGINSSPLSYGLGAGIADINQDGWPDIYVSNDYTIPDRLYINNRKGGFTDQLKTTLGQTSQFSMGNDVADVNNDGTPDIFTLDMLPEDNRRQKLLMAPDNYDKFDMTVRSGFHYQYMRNMLHLGGGAWRETAQMAGISNTDWSWAALFADYDNDGWKDLFVTNGYLRDYTNLDFLKYMEDFQKSGNSFQRQDVLNLVQQMPASNVVNYIFKNNKNLTFKNVVADWGLNQPSNSNGAAYADLDNDGDLDLVVNNINAPAFICQNNADKLLKNNYLKIKLTGSGLNRFGVGTKIRLFAKGQSQYVEQMPARGFQSSVSPVVHFGLGNVSVIDSLQVVWPSQKQQVLKNIKANQQLVLEEKNATQNYKSATPQPSIFKEIEPKVAFKDPEIGVNDFKRQQLMISPQSYDSPCMAKADVNKDGLEDLYIGGTNGQTGALFLQQKNGQFSKNPQPDFEKDKGHNDTDAAFFDANADGFLDLYVCSGGYHNLQADDALLQDRLYLNNGRGVFTKNNTALPKILTSSGCVSVGDLNLDQKPDLFVGGRVSVGRYPEAPRSYVLINVSVGNNIKFVDNTPAEIKNIGMVTDAAWADINADKKPDLVMVGEFMPITIFENLQGKLINKTTHYFDKNYNGLWNKLLIDDFNNDGRPDIVAGNWGLNSQLKATHSQPAELFFKDFDDNGTTDPIFNFYIQNKSYPYVTRDELISQMPMIGRRFTDYKSYAEATLKDIFSESELQNAKRLEVNWLQTTCFVSSKTPKFETMPLPIEVQLSPVFTITAVDFDKDGKKDVLLCGNQHFNRLRLGRFDANHGILLKNNGKSFSYIPQNVSGFQLNGDVRSVVSINNKLIFGVNQSNLRSYQLRE